MINIDLSESEFNDFERAASQILEKLISIERRLKSCNIEYNFKWNQPYLSRISNLAAAQII